ncbi:MAG: ATP-binding protein, partial [Janthinobacterium lividum]
MAEVSIQPPSDVYDTFGRLNYKPWYALAEFVDNATQNYADHRGQLLRTGQEDLHVDIRYDNDSLSITDDANGMNLEEFSRAIRLNAKPPNQGGRSEFGMGLKTAACWFGRRWVLTSTRLGEPTRYQVTFDLESISQDKPTTIHVSEEPADPHEHGTQLRIEELRNRIHGRAGQTVRKSLASMYRGDLLSGLLLSVNRERLVYDPPPLYSEALPDGRIRTWQTPIDLDVTDPHTGLVHKVTGWAGIREKMSRQESGFALMRRGRLVIGGYAAGWRPGEIFGQVASARWQRLTGELHCNTFPVNFSKDGFAWDSGLEEALIEALLPPLGEYRTKAGNIKKNEHEVSTADLGRAAADLQQRFDASDLRRDLTRLETPSHPATDPVDDPTVREEMVQQAEGPAELKVPLPVGFLTARLYLARERPGDDWMTPSFAHPDEVDVFLNTAHPWVAAASGNEAALQTVVQFALATALAEKRARYVGGE